MTGTVIDAYPHLWYCCENYRQVARAWQKYNPKQTDSNF